MPPLRAGDPAHRTGRTFHVLLFALPEVACGCRTMSPGNIKWNSQFDSREELA